MWRPACGACNHPSIRYPASLVSVQVGKPRLHGTWRTGYFKAPVDGPVWLGRTNLVGDAQANRRVHGGPDKAVLAYAASHYTAWRAELDLPKLSYGAFAENFSIDGLDEDTVCLGDIFRIGSARLQVSQPRQPCINIARRWQMPDLAERVAATGRTGWYLRVLIEGQVEAGLRVDLVERLCPDWTISRATRAMTLRASAPAEAATLREVPGLSAAWRRTLSRLRT